MTATVWRISLLAVLATPIAPATGLAQEWRVSARLGQMAYEGAPAGTSGVSSVVLGIGRTGLSDWLGVSAALPLGQDPFWAVLSGWKRLETKGRFGLLLDLSSHGFIQRQSATTSGTTGDPLPGPFQPPLATETDLTGEGAGGELMAGGFVGSSSLRLESRAGVAAQRSRLGDVLQERALPNGDVKLSLVRAPFTVQAETRGWLDEDQVRAHAGGTIHFARGPLQLWGSAGKWVKGGLTDVTWSAGGSIAIAPQIELQLGGRGNTFDPLYFSTTRTSFWTGLSLRIGGRRTLRPPVPGRAADGRVVIRISANSTKGMPAIAGDFTGWKPMPMQRDGSLWTYTARLDPGTYHYAFVGEDGTWFVPQSTPGRRADGMGGYVAVLVVS